MHRHAASIPVIAELVIEAGEIPPQTCPLINKVIAQIRSSEKTSGKATRNLDDAELADRLSDIASELWGAEDTLEDIREANDKLRGLGEFWYCAYKELHRTHENVVDEFESLEEELTRLAAMSVVQIATERARSTLQTWLARLARSWNSIDLGIVR